MKNQFFISDIKTLLHLHAPKKYNLFIFDPKCCLEEDAFSDSYAGEDFPNVLLNFTENTAWIRGNDLDQFDLILHFGAKSLSINHKGESFRIVKKRDGKMRWIYPIGKIATVLKLYTVCSVKSRLKSLAIKATQKLRLERLVARQKLIIYSKGESKLKSILNNIDFDSHTLFMGTDGFDRTPIMALHIGESTPYYAKFALNKHTAHSIMNERSHLAALNMKSLDSFNVPQVITETDSTILVTTNVSRSGAKHKTNLTKNHISALNELMTIGAHYEQIRDTVFWEDYLNNLSFLRSLSLNGIQDRLYKLLQSCDSEIQEKDMILTTRSHGDFTPWNMTLKDNKLFLYDWELAKQGAPALYDLFHFCFQNNIILGNKDQNTIFKHIHNACSDKSLSDFIEKHKLDITTYIKLYLLQTVSYYLTSFQHQASITREQETQMIVWENALKSILSFTAEASHRNLFISEFHNNIKQYKHAFLKFKEKSFENLSSSSDLDIAMVKSDLSDIETFCSKHMLVVKVTHVRKSFMSTLQLFFRDGSYLSLDLIHDMRRKHVKIMEIEPLIESAKPNEFGICVPHLKYDLEYALLFYFINGSAIPEKYRDHYCTNLAIQNEILNYITIKYDLTLPTIQSLFEYSSLVTNQLNKNLPHNSITIVNRLEYLLDTFKDLRHNQGSIVTFSGVDGAGKSTVISNITECIEHKYRKQVVVLRHRPGILPIISSIRHGGRKNAEQAASERLPRQGKNTNTLSSLLRFSYYYTDYLFGQVYIYSRYILFGKVVVFDRYYFDFINDSKRSNILLNKSIIKSLYALIIKPKLNIHLSASPATIWARKQELTKETISHLDNDYKQLFKQFDNKYKHSRYCTIVNLDLKNTIDLVMMEYAQIA